MTRRHVLIIIIILLAGYFLGWHLKPTRELSFLVVDKTVPETTYREHRAIFWIAEHRRFTAAGERYLKHERDYLGYHPDSDQKDMLSDDHLDNIELLYLADSYGIYDYEEGLEVYEDKLPYKHQAINLIYGGLSYAETEIVCRFADRAGHLLIGEHNIIGYPTYLDPAASLMLQDLFGISYTGWLVRYYADLDLAAFWIKELYSRIYGQEWKLHGPGMVFVREENAYFDWNTDLLIIEQEHFEKPWPVLINTNHQLLDGANTATPYLYWLEVHEVSEQAAVIAYYDLPVNSEGREALLARGLPEKFAAMVYYTPPGKAGRIYFAGDFADQIPALLPANLTGSAAIQRFMSYFPGLPLEYRFYFQWYEPVINNILQTGSY